MRYVLAEDAVAPERLDGTAATHRMATSENLEQRIVTYAPGRSAERTLAGRQEVLFVVSGRGAIEVDARRYELEPDTGVYLVAGDTYAVVNPGPQELKVVAVSAPEEREASPDPERRIVRYADQPPLPASPNREFRYLVNEVVGCNDVTQFVGIIPPGRAGMHSHTYDEVLYVIEGEGVLHFRGTETPLRPGSCLHLPPLERHALENTGPQPMRVLGVFHPSGDPASRAYESNI